MHNDRRCEPHSGASQLGAETHRRASPLPFSLRYSEIRLPRRIWSTRADVAFWPMATLPQEFISAMPPKADKPEPTFMTRSRRQEDH